MIKSLYKGLYQEIKKLNLYGGFEITQMQAKDIKTIIRKQIKKQYPNWNRLSKKQKKTIAKEVLTEVVKGYDVNQEIRNPLPELLGIEEQVSISGIMTLD